MTFRHRAGVSPYISAFAFAETCVFGKQSPGPFHCGHACAWHPFSRSYGVILPSSLTIVLSLTLGSSPHLPVSVCGTGTSILDSGFSWQPEIRYFGTYFPSPSQINLDSMRICLHAGLFAWARSTNGALIISFCVPTSLLADLGGTGIFYLLSIAYALRPRLRSRLTLSGRTFLRKPWIFGGQDSHLPRATHANILSPMQSTRPLSLASVRIRCSSTASI